MKKEIKTTNAPLAIGAYSQGIIAGNMIFISGQLPINHKNQQIPNNIKEQTINCLNNITNILKEAGSSLEKIVKCGIFIKNIEDFAIINEIYSSYFKEPYPARFVVEVSRLPKNVLIEIDAIAFT